MQKPVYCRLNLLGIGYLIIVRVIQGCADGYDIVTIMIMIVRV